MLIVKNFLADGLQHKSDEIMTPTSKANVIPDHFSSQPSDFSEMTTSDQRNRETLFEDEEGDEINIDPFGSVNK